MFLSPTNIHDHRNTPYTPSSACPSAMSSSLHENPPISQDAAATLRQIQSINENGTNLLNVNESSQCSQQKTNNCTPLSTIAVLPNLGSTDNATGSCLVRSLYNDFYEIFAFLACGT